jgi:hypothetical protein
MCFFFFPMAWPLRSRHGAIADEAPRGGADRAVPMVMFTCGRD